MSKSVNILGDTPKQQWMNAVSIFEMCLDGNARIVRDGMCEMCEGDCDECEQVHSINVVIEQTKVFADEMRRLVEGVLE